MTLLETLDPEETRNLLTRCWMTHDAMWFATTLASQGIDTANRLNRSAIKAMVDIEVGRFLKVMNLAPDQVRTFEGFTQFFRNIREMLIPEFMDLAIGFEAPDTIFWQAGEKGCFAYRGVRRLKVETRYQCGVLYRIQRWLTSLDIPVQMIPSPKTCLMNELGHCRGRFVCRFTP